MKVLDSISTVGRARDREPEGRSSERLQNIGLAALGVVAAVGVVFALRGPGPADDAGPVTPVPAVSDSPTEEPTSDPTSDPTSGETGSESADPDSPIEPSLTSVLVAQEGSTVVRTPVVECVPGLEPIVVQTATDGGEWEASQVPDLVSVTGLHIQGEAFVRVVGFDPECSPASYVSRDAGATWRPTANEVRFWSILPGNERQVATPTGAVRVPCAPRQVSAINGTVARVWCDSGQIVGTADGGANWVALGSLAEAESIAYLDAADGVALAMDPECTGVSVLVTRDGGSDWETVHCAEIAGPWGVLATPTTITVIGGDAQVVSEDVGESWSEG